MNLKTRHFLKLLDFEPEEIHYLLKLSAQLKADKKTGKEKQHLKGKNIALIFEKASTRTRCAFEVAAMDQGAGVTYLEPSVSQIGHKESIKDTARVLGRMYDGIEYRGFEQHKVEELAQYAGVPVFNGLTNEFHPTQVLADILTMQEHSNKPLHEISFCYLGDARNNMANSLLLGGAILGMNVHIAAPSSLWPSEDIINQAQLISMKSGADIMVTDNVDKAIKQVDFVYTDVWVSMGEAEEEWKQRIKILKPYRVTTELLNKTANPEVKFMHCLPAIHNDETKIGNWIFKNFGLDGAEVTNEVFESDASIVFDQAENRMHTIKAILVAMIE